MIRNLIDKYRERCHCDYRRLCLTSKKVELNILTVTKVVEKNSVEMREIKGVEEFECFTFRDKKVIMR